MDQFDKYDAWKLDNNEKPCRCDKCEEVVKDETLAFDAMGEYELVCETCADNMTPCPRCDRVGDDECYSYGHDEFCDDCCDYMADS